MDDWFFEASLPNLAVVHSMSRIDTKFSEKNQRYNMGTYLQSKDLLAWERCSLLVAFSGWLSRASLFASESSRMSNHNLVFCFTVHQRTGN